MDDDYQEMENDFEDGKWIGGEFYYRKRKDKPIQTKDGVLYGVFSAQSNDDDDDYGYPYRKRRKDGNNLSHKPDLSKHTCRSW